jgi:hypothetical protein
MNKLFLRRITEFLTRCPKEIKSIKLFNLEKKIIIIIDDESSFSQICDYFQGTSEVDAQGSEKRHFIEVNGFTIQFVYVF